MNVLPFSQVTETPQDFILVSNKSQKELPLDNNNKMVQSTPQNLPYSVVTTGPQVFAHEKNANQYMNLSNPIYLKVPLPVSLW